MKSEVEVKLRGVYVKTMLDQLEKQSATVVKKQKAPGMALELVMAQFVAAGMFLCEHAKPQLAEDLFRDMMQNRRDIQKQVETQTEEMINNAIKAVANDPS